MGEGGADARERTGVGSNGEYESIGSRTSPMASVSLFPPPTQSRLFPSFRAFHLVLS